MSSPNSLSLNLIAVLQASPQVTNVVGTKCYRMRAPQDTKPPYMIVWVPTHQRYTTLAGITNLENSIVRFDFFGANFLQLDLLRDAVIELMSAQFLAVYKFGTELYEDDTRLFHLMADFSVHFDRN